jgi:hypothetical protein
MEATPDQERGNRRNIGYARTHKYGTCTDRQTKGCKAKAKENGMDWHCLDKDTVGSGEGR